MSNQALETEVLNRLLHAHPEGLGKEVLDNYRGERAVADTLLHLQEQGLIHHGTVEADKLNYPVKLTAAGVSAAKSAH